MNFKSFWSKITLLLLILSSLHISVFAQNTITDYNGFQSIIISSLEKPTIAKIDLPINVISNQISVFNSLNIEQPSQFITIKDSANLVFLANPNTEYRLFFADESKSLVRLESRDLKIQENQTETELSLPKPNPEFLAIDSDKDEIPNKTDNCSNIFNPGQEDSNLNGIGDVCDTLQENVTSSNSSNNIKPNLENQKINPIVESSISAQETGLATTNLNLSQKLPFILIGIIIILLIPIFWITLTKKKK